MRGKRGNSLIVARASYRSRFTSLLLIRLGMKSTSSLASRLSGYSVDGGKHFVKDLSLFQSASVDGPLLHILAVPDPLPVRYAAQHSEWIKGLAPRDNCCSALLQNLVVNYGKTQCLEIASRGKCRCSLSSSTNC